MGKELSRYGTKQLIDEIERRKKAEDLAAAAGQSKMILEEIGKFFDDESYSTLRYNERSNRWMLALKLPGGSVFDAIVDDGSLYVSQGLNRSATIKLHNPNYLSDLIEFMCKMESEFINSEIKHSEGIIAKSKDRLVILKKWKSKYKQKSDDLVKRLTWDTSSQQMSTTDTEI